MTTATDIARYRPRLLCAPFVTALLALALCLPIKGFSTDQALTINMRDADITAVIQWMAEQTNKKVVVDPRVKAKVTVLANQPMDTDQAYEVFLAMLDVYGFAATEAGGILRIFPASLAKTSPRDLIDSFDGLGSGSQILYVYRASKVSATSLVELLRPLLPGNGYISAFPETNSLIIADSGANVKRLVTMIKRMDESGQLDIEVLPLQYANAANVAGLVESLLANETQAAFTVASDDRSNSLLMSGSPATRNRVKQLVAQLDQPLDSTGNTRVSYLHYMDAAELLPILRGMSSAVSKDNTDSNRGSTISIEASESANALIMTAPTYMLDEMQSVIDQVDIRRAQVLVEAIIVEVSKDFTETIGVEWNSSLNSEGVEGITNFGGRVIAGDQVSLLGNGLSLGFYRNGSLRALVRAIAKETDANILSTPSILTLDNQEAEILVGSNVPFITGQSTGSSSSTNDPFTTITREDIGLSLKITPQINEGDSITLDVLQEIETIAQSTLVSNDIVTNKRSIKTKVLVEDEAILVLGGLVSDETQELVNKVPLLGDIPLLGQLFRTTTQSIIKKNLMVFIHPVIIDSDKIANEVSENRYQVMQDLQKKYNSGKFKTKDVELSDFTEYTPQKA
ncbi:MAG: general secretion pathway protein D, partial [Oceanicoccus sp.]